MADCSVCSAPTSSACRICDDCIAADIADQCAAQGVPVVVDDPVTLAQLADVFREPHIPVLPVGAKSPDAPEAVSATALGRPPQGATAGTSASPGPVAPASAGPGSPHHPRRIAG